MSKNLCSKMRPANNPYEVWQLGSWEWSVLKKYQSEEAEAKNPHARWFCLVKSAYVPDGELGDVYVQDIKSKAHKTA
jgi:hypothetical protein